MALLSELESRCESKCELCGETQNLEAYLVPPRVEEKTDNQVATCQVCRNQLANRENRDEAHWRCVQESIWSPVESVQVVSYRMLNFYKEKPWAQDSLGMVYLDEGTMEWIQSVPSEIIEHADSNGNVLKSGDTVTLIQDLNVKGGGFTAKRGTAVRRIRLVMDNPDQIEGKIDGQQIVILTKYVKKT